MSEGRNSHLNAVKRCLREQKPLYGLNYELDVVRARNIPSCVLSSSIMGENAQGSTYS